ncbi:hypothetical protein NPIL_81131 [Nephila pilipes]|uniref:Uncharacterized protein n=1 Tax=Nephila pilipes TaxID=299642 RepID=A0A8X6TMN5_NEPPI|nr:hypothetical protein NPIL_81131 [Nephila pilipes]
MYGHSKPPTSNSVAHISANGITSLCPLYQPIAKQPSISISRHPVENSQLKTHIYSGFKSTANRNTGSTS